MFCIAFGLSMDYEVFLLSRIKEEHDRGADTVTSVAVGLERTGRIVTAAAALLAIVFISFATSHVTFIKLFGIGLTLAVLMDATLIRGTLVPGVHAPGRQRQLVGARAAAPGLRPVRHQRVGTRATGGRPRSTIADIGPGRPAAAGAHARTRYVGGAAIRHA